ncbi:hypothetical protein HDU98_006626 [Podochytrium sp. JEL0797]|nr:hypothetical protein HDU98_006626 [Podochytrium sp. JEL0797]
MPRNISNIDKAAIAIVAIISTSHLFLLLFFLWFVICREIPAKSSSHHTFKWSTGFTPFNQAWFIGCVALFVMALSEATAVILHHNTEQSGAAYLLENFALCVGEICYVTFSWSRSRSLVKHVSKQLETFMITFTRVFPLITMTQMIPTCMAVFIPGTLAESPLYFATSIITPIAIIIYDGISLYCFSAFLNRTIIPGDSVSSRPDPTFITVSVYGTISCIAILFALCMYVPVAIFGREGVCSNLLGAVIDVLLTVVFVAMLVMKVKLFWMRREEGKTLDPTPVKESGELEQEAECLSKTTV